MPRHHFDPLARRNLPHWLTVADMFGAKLECSPVAPGMDLHGVMAEAIANLTADGWQAESDGRHGFLFVNRNGERRLVNLTAVYPGAPLGAGHAYLVGNGSTSPQGRDVVGRPRLAEVLGELKQLVQRT